MPVTTHVDETANIITYHASGELTLDEVRDAVESIYDSPSFHPGMHALWNLKESHIAIGVGELPELVGMLRGRDDRRGTGFKVALLVRSNEDFGVSSLFEMRAYDLPFHVQVFRSSREATDWLAHARV